MGQTTLYHSAWVAGTPISVDGMDAALLAIDTAIARYQHLVVARDGYLTNSQSQYYGLVYAWYLNSAKAVKKAKTAAENNTNIYGDGFVPSVFPSTVVAVGNEAGGTLAKNTGSPTALQWGNTRPPVKNYLTMPLWCTGANLQAFTSGGHCTRVFRTDVTVTAAQSHVDVKIPYSDYYFTPVIQVEPKNAGAWALYNGGAWALSAPLPGGTDNISARVSWGISSSGGEVFAVHVYAYI